MSSIADSLIAWHRAHGRHDLPWQGTRDPYRVWLAEIMLQQTQVATVIPFYQRFLERLPTLAALAAASTDEVMSLWSGLGYYARARNLHRCAQQIVSQHQGCFPREAEQIAALPGIGRSTANAIAVCCFAARAPILDGNVKRLLCRLLGIDGYPGSAKVSKRLWREAEELLPAAQLPTYIQAQMDLGAMICRRSQPLCEACPLLQQCVAQRQGRTAELPTPRPSKPLPQRQTTVLLLQHAGKILLQRRAPQGIWGGLWSLPELPPGEQLQSYASRNLGARITTIKAGGEVSHSFTHFRLLIQPQLCAAEPLPTVMEAELAWFAPEMLDATGMPAPIRRIVQAAVSATA